MNKLLLLLALAVSAYGSSLTATTICTPSSGPAGVVIGPGGCLGGEFQFSTNSAGFDATFSLFPDAYFAGGCENPFLQSGCGTTEMAVAFSDDLYFSQAGFATFYVDRFSNIPGNPFGQVPNGTIGGQSWTSGTIQVAVGPGQPVHIEFFADWIGQCCAGGADNGVVILSLSKIEFTDLNGNTVPIGYDAASGITWASTDAAATPEPSSVLLSALGIGILMILGRRKLRCVTS